MAFGRPRREDLPAYLVDRVSPERYRSNEASVSAIYIFILRVKRLIDMMLFRMHTVVARPR
jgi:hypothetical protein